MLSTFALLLFFIGANLPWLTRRVLLVIAIKREKAWPVRLGELLVYYMLCLGGARLLEQQYSGVAAPQQWEFYVVTLCLFLVFSVPGLIYHYQWKKLKMYS